MINFLYPWFMLDTLSGFVAIAIAAFFILISLYSFKFIMGRPGRIRYYFYLVLTALVSIAAVLANHLLLLFACWGFLGLMLYLLINMGDKDSSKAAKKAIIIVGGSDALMLLGIGIIYSLTGTFQMDKIKIALSTNYYLLSTLAYLCLAIACFAKAGAMPFHSWIPDTAQSAPVSVTAYLPASLDKLLGIYLLARVSLDLFIMNSSMNAFLMLVGAFTIIAGVMMALVQHDLKRLLGYHAVSQVGYMVLGIGTGNPLGIAGGLFHMLNNTVYKSCLFLTAGNVEYRARTCELNKLGGLAKLMPITYITCMIASFSISGIPPFNGFVSKWLIYQGLVLQMRSAGSSAQLVLGIFCLISAMFGSALTLASFVKSLHAVFLGERRTELRVKDKGEVSWQMWLPCVILAGACVIFGIFAFLIPLKYFIFPVLSLEPFKLAGDWLPILSTILLISGLALGLIVFNLSKLRLLIRKDSAFTGSGITKIQEEDMITGVDFYNTIKEIGLLRRIYKMAKKGVFDIYEQGKHIFTLSKLFRYLHNGVLPTYLVWMLLGMVGLFWILVR